MTKPIACTPRHSLTVRLLEANDVVSYREMRLEGLKDHREAFSSSWEYEAGKPESWWTERLEMNTVLNYR